MTADDTGPGGATITLITSGSYAADELIAEFGRLPPAFLPVGHERLYDVQVRLLGPGAHLTLPASYTVPEADRRRLEAAGVATVMVPDGLRLGESVLFALEAIGGGGAVRILHGDTVIHDLPAGFDVLAVGDPPEAYEWGAANGGDPGAGKSGAVLAGYFAFADGAALCRALRRADGDFVAAIHAYGRDRSLATRQVGSWLDYGHLQTYYRSRCSMRIQRAFNLMDISFSTVEKRSSDRAKLAAEMHWYETVPPRLRLHTPAFLGAVGEVDGNSGYAVEYLPLPSLHELLVFGDLGESRWRTILDACLEFGEQCLACAPENPGPTVIRALTVDKTAARLDAFLAAAGIPTDREWRYRGQALPSLHRIAALAAERIDMDRRSHLGVMQGDFCFTNIFFDFRTRRVRVIDPRGTIDGLVPTIAGDARYDLAKLAHSIAGYDFILAGRFDCSGFAERDLAIAFPAGTAFGLVNALAADFALRGVRLDDPQIVAITVHLFLSMLPLHSDNPARQRAFVANALRLFAEVLAR